jgi:DNA-directed RNA polymerase subunit M/transcription elongation factor TFIIS
MSETIRQYPVRCVRCKEEKGLPFLVRTVSGQPSQIEIKLRCRDCGHEWAQVIATDN